ncbi:hypothetical protein HH1059_16160 [Halorhodospira halochloris]|uniref:Uncharacterized protein n=1 Tax=Halorhodospira halochloris TaxID=1052 RepID=A0A2Z6EZL1_HALHR|nr:hypothetical protein HH1059_16160 [Halorhodospira halochloris]
MLTSCLDNSTPRVERRAYYNICTPNCEVLALGQLLKALSATNQPRCRETANPYAGVLNSGFPEAIQLPR